MTPCDVLELGQHLYNGLSPVRCQMISSINTDVFVNGTIGNKLHWIVNQNINFFIQWNELRSGVCRMQNFSGINLNQCQSPSWFVNSVFPNEMACCSIYPKNYAQCWVFVAWQLLILSASMRVICLHCDNHMIASSAEELSLKYGQANNRNILRNLNSLWCHIAPVILISIGSGYGLVLGVTKPLLGAMVTYFAVDPKEQTAVKVGLRYNNCHSRKYIWNWRPFCSGLNVHNQAKQSGTLIVLRVTLSIENMLYPVVNDAITRDPFYW